MSNVDKKSRSHLLIEIGLLSIGTITSAILAPFIVLFPPLRYLIFRICLINDFWNDKYALIIKIAVLVFYTELIIGLPLLSVALLGMDHLFDGIIAAGLFVAFFAFQYHRMFPPNFAVTFTNKNMDFQSYSKSLRIGITEPIFFSFTNIGLVHLKNCGSSIQFDKSFEVRGNPKYTVSRSKLMQFKPGVFDMVLPPLVSQQMVAFVQTPSQEGSYRIKCELYSESTWGKAHRIISLNIIQDNGAL